MTKPKPKPRGQKDDAGKLEWDLIPWEAMSIVTRTFMYGTSKYGRNNWRLVDDRRRRYINAAFRHLIYHQRGFYLDDEPDGSGLPHLAHAIASLLIALESEIEIRTVQPPPVYPPSPDEWDEVPKPGGVTKVKPVPSRR